MKRSVTKQDPRLACLSRLPATMLFEISSETDIGVSGLHARPREPGGVETRAPIGAHSSGCAMRATYNLNSISLLAFS